MTIIVTLTINLKTYSYSQYQIDTQREKLSGCCATYSHIFFIKRKNFSRSRKDVILQFSLPKLTKDDVVNKIGHQFPANPRHLTSSLTSTSSCQICLISHLTSYCLLLNLYHKISHRVGNAAFIIWYGDTKGYIC